MANLHIILRSYLTFKHWHWHWHWH